MKTYLWLCYIHIKIAKSYQNFDDINFLHNSWIIKAAESAFHQRINFSYFLFYFRRLQDALLQGVYDQEISELHIGDNEKSSSEVKSDEKIEIMNPFKPEDIP